MIFQSYALWPHMTAFQNVAYPLQGRRMKKKEIAERVGRVFELVGIPELQRQYPGQMSGGQQQRVALARALVAGGDLVLFDEPLSNVDAKVREQLRFELLSMQRELGFAAVYVTHDQAEAMELAHRIAVMRAGSIVQVAPPQTIYTEPATRYVASFVGTSNELEGTVTVGRRRLRRRRDGDRPRPRRRCRGRRPRASLRSRCAGPSACGSPLDGAGVPEPVARRGAGLRVPRRRTSSTSSTSAGRTFRVWSVDTRLLEQGTEVLDVRRARARPGAAGMSDFDPLAPETFTSFHEEFAELRQRCPVAHSDAYGGFWALTRLRRRRRRRAGPGDVHDDRPERRPEARVHR